MKSLQIFALLLLFKSLKGIEVGFGEDDISCSEQDGRIKVLITSTGYMKKGEAVVLVVMPVTLDWYLSTNHSLPEGVNLIGEDQAEAGADFNSTRQYVTFDHKTTQVELNIDVMRDGISENDEVFVIFLQAVPQTGEGVTVRYKRYVTVAHIEQPTGDKVTIGFNKKKIVVSEDSGTVEELFIEISGPMEPTVSVNLRTIDDKDVTIPSHLTISSTESRLLPVPLHVVDDLVAEQEECLYLSLQLDFAYRSLYSVNSAASRVQICITDNDIPKLGFQMEQNGNETGVGLEMLEGETRRLCVVLMEPAENDMYIKVNVSLSEDSPKDLIRLESSDMLDFYKDRECFEVTASDNPGINPPAQVQLQLSVYTSIFSVAQMRLVPGDVEVEPGLLTIRDNDGVPLAPSQITLEFEGDSLHMSWQSQASDLQPVDTFSVVIQATPTPRVSRRQAAIVQVPSLGDSGVWEYETKDTSLTMDFAEPSKAYTVSVCAVNGFGRECSEPKEIIGVKRLPQPEGLASIPTDNGPSRSVIIALAVVVPVMAVLLCMAVLCAVVICRCYGRSKEYMPAKQEKIFSVRGNFLEPKYCTQTSSTSSASMEWRAADFTDYITTPSAAVPSSRPVSNILGTPV